MEENIKLGLYALILQVIMIIQLVCMVDLFLEKQKVTFKKAFWYILSLLGVYVIALPHFNEVDFYIGINSIILCCMVYNGKILHKSLCILVSLGIISATEMLNQAFIDQFMKGYFPSDKWERLILQLGSMILVLVFIIILKGKRLFKGNKQAYELMRKREVIILSLPAVFSISIACMGIFIYAGSIQVAHNKIFLCIVMAGAVLLDLSLIVIINHSMRIDYYKKLNQVIEAQLNKQLAYYERLEEVNSETRAIKHDVRNHMLVINDLLKNGEIDELKRYVADMTQSVIINTKFIQTGNPIADAILNEKYRIACDNKIDMHVDFKLSKEMSIDAIDLCTILSNSIDNAIEACSKIEREQDRELEIIGRMNHGYLIIQVSNKTEEEILIINNTIKTSKKDKKQHGYGLANIKSSVAKYKGAFNLSFKEHYFTLEVIINTSHV